MKTVCSLALAGFFSLAAPAIAESFDAMFPGIASQLPETLTQRLSKIDTKTGEVFLGGGIATINVPDDYYYLEPQDAAFVLSELWGNPEASNTLGMVFPVKYSPIHNGAWGIDINFDAMGYVSDEDAENYDYDDVLKSMQASTREANVWRKNNGYPSIELVGWAAAPHYNAQTRKLYWAQQLRFEGEEKDTLNYNIRALGRKGVLVVNFISGIDQLSEVEAAVPDVLEMVNFTEGNRYADFNPDVDTVAAVGLGGLIAGKALAKTGFLAVALIFLKKFWFLALIPLFALKNFFFRSKGS